MTVAITIIIIVAALIICRRHRKIVIEPYEVGDDVKKVVDAIAFWPREIDGNFLSSKWGCFEQIKRLNAAGRHIGDICYLMDAGGEPYVQCFKIAKYKQVWHIRTRSHNTSVL